MEKPAKLSGSFGRWFRLALDGSNPSDLLSNHCEFFGIGLGQHPLDEDADHLHLFGWQRMF